MYAASAVPRRSPAWYPGHACPQDTLGRDDAWLWHCSAHRAPVGGRTARAGGDALPGAPGDGSEGLGSLGMEADAYKASRALLLDHGCWSEAARAGRTGVRSRRRGGDARYAARVSAMPIHVAVLANRLHMTALTMMQDSLDPTFMRVVDFTM